jgi:hypothetical protein
MKERGIGLFDYPSHNVERSGLEGCHAEAAKILTWRCLETHDGTQQ